jgi:biotin operon repressor
MTDANEARNRLLNGWQLSKMYTFEVAARHESFALAAEELSLSPSAVSHRINLLEEELGIQLFVRSHRKVELTQEESAFTGRKIVPRHPESGDPGHQKPGAVRHADGLLPAVDRPVLAGAHAGGLYPPLSVDFTHHPDRQ